MYAVDINSLAPGRSSCDFKNVIFNLPLLIGIFKSSYDNVLKWMPQDLTDDKSTLVQVIAWCRQASSHYLSQCWLRSMSPNGVTRPQWVNQRYSSIVIYQRVNVGTGMCQSILWHLPVPMLTPSASLIYKYFLLKFLKYSHIAFWFLNNKWCLPNWLSWVLMEHWGLIT